MNYNNLVHITNKWFNNTYIMTEGSNNLHSIIFPVEPSTQYTLDVTIASDRLSFCAQSPTDEFIAGNTYDKLNTTGDNTHKIFTTNENAHYVFIYLNSSETPYVYNPDNIKLYKGNKIPEGNSEKLLEKYLPDDLINIINYNNDIESIDELNTKIECILNAYKYEFDISNTYLVPSNGLASSSNADYVVTDFISCDINSKIILLDTYSGSSSASVAFYDSNKDYIPDSSLFNQKNGEKGANLYNIEIPQDTAFVRFGTRKYNGETQITDTKAYVINKIQTQEQPSINYDNNEIIETINNYLFDKGNILNNNLITVYSGYPGNNTESGSLLISNTNTTSIIFPVEPNTKYFVYVSGRTRSNTICTNDDEFISNTYYTLLSINSNYTTYNNESVLYFVSSADAKYAMVYIYNGTYDITDPNNEIIIMKNIWNPQEITSSKKIKEEYIPDITNISLITGTSILVFGDSITTAENFTINEDIETIAHSKNHPSNSYTNSDGNLIRYSKWPEILEYSENPKELRNYAMSGASFKTSTRLTGNERQNLHYQIDLAINDIPNKHNAFPTEGNFDPDIIIFALGTNDGAPNDSYDDAMNKTVFVTGTNNNIDVDATINNLSEDKFCESARKAFLRIRKQFPMAQVFCCLPIQRSENETNVNLTNIQLEKIAKRCGCIIIDLASNSGLIREGNIPSDLGTTLKDGLHPNEYGQNLMAREIISQIRSHYIPLNKYGFNEMQ